MKERIQQIRDDLPYMVTTTQAEIFDDRVDGLIAEAELQVELLENYLRYLQIDIGMYALKYSDDLPATVKL